MTTCDKIDSVLSEKECFEFKKIFLKNSYTLTDLGDKCYGIDINNKLSYPWFNKIFWPKITKYFDEDLKLIYASYASFTKPFSVHRDDFKTIPNNKKGTNYLSLLIPISVDNNKDLCSLASTIVFKQQKNPNAKQDHENYLSHCHVEELYNRSIDRIFQWKIGDIIWWKSEVDHCSSHFKNFSSKESFVIHTYVE